MINLLPDETKRDIRAARMNVILLRYNLLAAGAAALMVLVCLIFYVILQDNQSQALNTTNDNNAKAASFASVRKEANEYRDNLTLASKIIDNGVSYTNVIIAITKLIPSGVILDNLTLSAQTFSQQTTFAGHAKSYEAAAKLKESFQNSKIFSDVYFQSLTTSGPSTNGGGSNNAYPIVLSLSAKLSKAAAQ